MKRTHTVISPCTRKSFFAKLAGLLAGLGIVPAVLEKLGARPTAAVVAPLTLRPEPRAIARKDGDV